MSIICSATMRLSLAFSVFSRLMSLRLHVSVLLPPGIERRRADPVAPADLIHLRSGLLLLQHVDDLLIAEPLVLHGSPYALRATNSPELFPVVPSVAGWDNEIFREVLREV